MRVVGVGEFGGPEAFRVFEVPEPHAGPGQVRIAVRAAAVNPTDTYTRNGARAEMLSKHPPPYVPGMDVAGVVDEVGDGVSSVAVGEDVMAIVVPVGGHGGYSEKIVLPWESVVPIPRGATHVEACTLPMNGLTARLSLDLMALAPGATIAVTGAAGAYGGYMVQLARADGLTVIADASDRDTALVASLGPDHVVVDGLADGSVQNDQIVPAVRDGGVIATVRGWQADPGRGIRIVPVWVREYARNHVALDVLRQQVEDGRVSLRVARTRWRRDRDRARVAGRSRSWHPHRPGVGAGVRAQPRRTRCAPPAGGRWPRQSASGANIPRRERGGGARRPRGRRHARAPRPRVLTPPAPQTLTARNV